MDGKCITNSNKHKRTQGVVNALGPRGWGLNSDRIGEDVCYNLRSKVRDFPGAPVAKTPHSQCREARLIPGQETDPTCCNSEFTCCTRKKIPSASTKS